MKYLILFPLFLFISCNSTEKKITESPISTEIAEKPIEEAIEVIPVPIATHFDYPVGKPNGKGYYNAQAFGKNNHLGDDWNAVTGGNTDLGDPIYAIANGKVTFAENIGGGWGNVIRITHRLPDSTFVESLYAHCNEIFVSRDLLIKRGAQIGTIGTANGAYLAHLHFEMRDDLELPIGGGYSRDTNGYLIPTKFIKEHR
ncbi:MAG: M23 family metallopeptidase [Nonlabens sp.]|uniref:M23 family metallopeptidase n=1 Tax=Nonlabens sp. TaxID=1888209 RepID=UPI003EF2235D